MEYYIDGVRKIFGNSDKLPRVSLFFSLNDSKINLPILQRL